MRRVTFDGHDLSGPFVVEDVRRPAMAEASPETIAVPGADGVVLAGLTVGPVTVEVDLRCIRPDKERVRQALRELAGWLLVREPRELTISDEPGLRRMAVPSGATDVEEFLSTGGLTVSFLCPEPFARGARRTVDLAAGDNEVRAYGTYPTRPTITAVPATGQGSWRATVDHGEYVEVSADFGGATLTLDFEGRAATMGTGCERVTLQSDWWEMAPGRHVVTVTSAATMTWEERWL